MAHAQIVPHVALFAEIHYDIIYEMTTPICKVDKLGFMPQQTPPACVTYQCHLYDTHFLRWPT